MKGKYSKFYEHFHYFLSKSPLMEENQAIFWQEKTENTKFSVQIEDKVFWKTSLRWVRTSANFYEVPWLIKIQRASADKVKIGSLTQNLSILGELIFLTQSAARVQLVLPPPPLFNFRAQAKTVSQTVLLSKLPSESGTEIGNSLEFDFVVPPPHSWVGL